MTQRMRVLSLLLLLTLSLAAYYRLNIHGVVSPRPPGTVAVGTENPGPRSREMEKLPAKVLENLRLYIQDVEIGPNENNLGYAMKLDGEQGRPAVRRGDDRAAYPIYRKVLAISYHQDSLQGVGVASGILSQIAKRANRGPAARKFAALQYQVSRIMNKPFELGVAEMGLANLIEDEAMPLALKLRLQAKEHLRGTPYVHDYIDLLSTLAQNNSAYKRYDIAFGLAEEAWSLAQKSGDSDEIASARAFAALQYAGQLKSRGRYNDAIAILSEAAERFPAVNRNTWAYYDLLLQIARNYAAQERWDDARRYYADAYHHFENERLNVLGDEGRAQLDRGNSQVIDGYVNSLAAGGNYAEALALLEANKARTLQDIGVDSNQQTAYRALTQMRRTQARERMELFETYQESGTADPLENILPGNEDRWEKLWQAEKELTDRQNDTTRKLLDQLQMRDLAVGESLSPERLKILQRKLRGNEAALSMFTGGNELRYFIMTAEKIDYFATGVTFDQYHRELLELRVALINPSMDFHLEPAKLLGDLILQPVLTRLPKKIDHLIYSPDGEFANLPLGVLMPKGRFLTRDYTIVRVPSLGVLRGDSLIAAHGTRGVSCVDPKIPYKRLPFQQQTGEHLVKLYGNRVSSLDGPACNVDRLEKALAETGSPAFLHVGAHGFFNEAAAMQSGILLSSDKGGGELWDAHAIGGLDLNAFVLVTLSSCETGLSDQEKMRDLFGLQRAILYGGSRQVLAPVWSVQDEATHRLISAFFDAYRHGADAASALQQAQRKLIRDPRFAHPYYWGGFVLSGDAI